MMTMINSFHVSFEKMPKTVITSYWQYGQSFEEKLTLAKTYIHLETYGYNQISAVGVNQNNGEGVKSISNAFQFCDTHIANPSYLGFYKYSESQLLKKHRKYFKTCLTDW